MEAHRDYYADFLFDSEAAARAATAALAATDATENGSAANGGGAPPGAETNGAAMNGANGASAGGNGAGGGGAGSTSNGKDEEDGVFWSIWNLRSGDWHVATLAFTPRTQPMSEHKACSSPSMSFLSCRALRASQEAPHGMLWAACNIQAMCQQIRSKVAPSSAAGGGRGTHAAMLHLLRRRREGPTHRQLAGGERGGAGEGWSIPGQRRVPAGPGRLT